MSAGKTVKKLLCKKHFDTQCMGFVMTNNPIVGLVIVFGVSKYANCDLVELQTLYLYPCVHPALSYIAAYMFLQLYLESAVRKHS